MNKQRQRRHWWIEQQAQAIGLRQLQLVILSCVVLVLAASTGVISLFEVSLSLVLSLIPWGLIAAYANLVCIQKKLQAAGIEIASPLEVLSFDASGARLHGKAAPKLPKNLHGSSIRERLQSVITLSIYSSWLITFTVLLGAYLQARLHSPLLLQPIHIGILGLLQLPILIAIASSSHHRLHHALALRPLFVKSLVGSIVATTVFFLFFWLQGVTSAYISDTSHLYFHAASLVFVVVLLGILFQAVGTQRKTFFNELPVRQALIATVLLILLVTTLYPTHNFLKTEALQTKDVLSLLLVGLVLFVTEHFHVHLRKHSRQEIIRLHRQVHGHRSPPKI